MLPCLTSWQLQLGQRLGQGAVGDVVAGMWLEQPAGIKIIYTHGWQPACSFMWEAKVYRRLLQLQGTCVPSLRCRRPYVGGTSRYFLTFTLLHGMALDELPKPLAPEVPSAALQLLMATCS